jgi:uncharacterized phage protein (predicted DNA packaging)
MADENQNTDPIDPVDPTPDPEPTPEPTIADKVKLALRISHNLLDSEISDVITSARQEMLRAGVDSEVAASDIELVQTAIKTYALEYYAQDPKDAERYSESFKYQLDCLRKSEITIEEE